MPHTINCHIDHIAVSIEEGATLLQAARKINIHIPTLCYHDDLCVAGNCRLCMVEQVAGNRLLPACTTPVTEGMEILTNSHKVHHARKVMLELLMSEHQSDCPRCYKNGKCELQMLASEYLIDSNGYINLVPFKNYTVDRLSPSIIKDDSKCIRCQRCVRTCAEIQGISALTVAHKGERMKISTFFDLPMNEVVCTNCGQCVTHCPTGALVERNYMDEVWQAIDDDRKHVVVQTAPAVRIALGEALGLDPGQIVTGKMVAALRRIGFDSVLDTDFSADLTIVEEGHELLQRLKGALKDHDPDVKLPMTTSCSPGWIKFMEHLYPDFLSHLSTAKSPQQMFGALAKTYYTQRIGVNPKNMVSVSVMPCTAKKFEASRPEMCASGFRDVDYVLTTRELATMVKQSGIDFLSLPDDDFDSIMGQSTGAGVIFGATGGVMEAALRTVYEVVTGREVPFNGLNIEPVRGLEHVKEATLTIEDPLPEWDFLNHVQLKTCVAHGLTNARLVMEKVKKGEADYHFIEIMACPGGCLGGGGQPMPVNDVIRRKRAEAIYREDAGKAIRKSHENPDVMMLYDEFLKVPLGHQSHKLLHTSYVCRNRY